MINWYSGGMNGGIWNDMQTLAPIQMPGSYGGGGNPYSAVTPTQPANSGLQMGYENLSATPMQMPQSTQAPQSNALASLVSGNYTGPGLRSFWQGYQRPQTYNGFRYGG